MAPAQAVIDAIDRIIECFNKRTLDLPDGFFDRRTQFVINGAPFETLLGPSTRPASASPEPVSLRTSRPPDDALILMLARGPAGYRFAIKALQHAIPDASIHVTPSSKESLSLSASAPTEVVFQLRLSGTLRGTGEAVDVIVPITLKLAAAGQVEIAEATLDESALDKIRQARLRP